MSSKFSTELPAVRRVSDGATKAMGRCARAADDDGADLVFLGQRDELDGVLDDEVHELVVAAERAHELPLAHELRRDAAFGTRARALMSSRFSM